VTNDLTNKIGNEVCDWRSQVDIWLPFLVVPKYISEDPPSHRGSMVVVVVRALG